MTFIKGRVPSPSTSHNMKINIDEQQVLVLMMLAHDGGEERRRVLEIALNGLRNIPNYDNFIVYPVVAYEPTIEMSKLILKLNDRLPFDAVRMGNDMPLGRRHNMTMKYILGAYPEMTHLMQIGSDDVITPSGYNIAMSWMAQGCPFGAFTTIGIVNSTMDKVKYHRGLGNAGAGRFMHRSLIDRTISELKTIWPEEAIKGLDGQSEKRIQDVTRCPIWPVNTYLPTVYDIKTNSNMWSYDHFDLPQRDFDRQSLTR